MAHANQFETWTSAVGSQIEGVYIGSSNSTHWIVSTEGRLYQLSSEQLSDQAVARIREMQAQMERQQRSRGGKGSSLIPITKTPEDERLIVALCSTRIANVQFQAMSIEAVLTDLNEMTEIEMPFRLEEGVQDRVVNIQLRNLYLNQILDFVTQQVGLSYRIDSGVVVVGQLHP